MYVFTVDISEPTEEENGFGLIRFPAFEEAGQMGVTQYTPEQDPLEQACDWLVLQVAETNDGGEPLPKDGRNMYPEVHGAERVYLAVPGKPGTEGKYVKKTLTVPESLNVAGQLAGVNFSELLRDALFERLYGIKKV